MREHTPQDRDDAVVPDDVAAGEQAVTPEYDERPERPDLPDFSKPRRVGEMLAAERRRQGKSVGDVAEATRIRGKLVEALEAGEYDHLPSPAYVRGYIQNYATALGLSAEPFLEAYRQETRAKSATQQRSGALGEPILPHRDQAHAIPGRVLVAVVALVVVVGVIWATLSLVGGGDETPAPLPPVDETTSQVETATGAAPGVTTEETDAQAAEASATVTPFELVVTVDDTDASWLRITVDGEKVYEGTLPGGESRTYEVTDLASIRIGRPSVVTITRDGQPVEIPNTGELPTVELAADE